MLTDEIRKSCGERVLVSSIVFQYLTAEYIFQIKPLASKDFLLMVPGHLLIYCHLSVQYMHYCFHNIKEI